MSSKAKLRLKLAILAGCFIVAGAIEDLSLYEADPKPSINAPVYVDWRTGEWVDP